MIDNFAYALLAAIVIGVICLTVRFVFNRVCAMKERNVQIICGTVIAGLSALKNGEYEVNGEVE